MANKEKGIVVLGAGKIGRGFIGDIFHRAGYSLCFVDADAGLVEKLRERNSYTVCNLPGENSREIVEIKGFEAFHTDEAGEIAERIAETDLAAVAVFPAALEATAEIVARGIEERVRRGNSYPLDIILCVNMLHPAERFRECLASTLSGQAREFMENKLGLIETVVVRVAIEPSEEMKREDPLVVVTNGYPELITDRTAFKGSIPGVPALNLTWDIKAEEMRKIFTFNMIHAMYAYLGKRKGHMYVADCTRDAEIQKTAVGALEEACLAVKKEYGFSDEDMDRWKRWLLSSMANPALKDTLDRVGADPVRKLRREDRLVGPALLCMAHGIRPACLARGIAHAFLFDAPGDMGAEEVRSFLREHGIRKAVMEFCGLKDEDGLIELIVSCYTKAVSRYNNPDS